MKRTVIYWKVSDMERRKEVKAALGITSVSVNGESEYKDDVAKLEPYIKEGLIVIRTKDYEGRRFEKECVAPNESKLERRRKIQKSSKRSRVR